MTDQKKLQKKADALFIQYPDIHKIFISENGQCFFDEKSSKDYHDLKGFDKSPEVFFREGHQDEDDSDLPEALQQSELKRLALETLIEEITAVCDLDQDYEPVNPDTDEALTGVIALREKLALAQNSLTEANAELEKLSGLQEEKENLERQLEALTRQLDTPAAPVTTTTPKNRRNASTADR